MFGTGEGPLGYELLSGTCVVQERGLWGTNYSPEHVWYRRGASDVRNATKHPWYRKMGSSVQNKRKENTGTRA